MAQGRDKFRKWQDTFDARGHKGIGKVEDHVERKVPKYENHKLRELIWKSRRIYF